MPEKIFVRFNKPEERNVFIKDMKNQGIDIHCLFSLNTVIATYESLEAFKKLTWEYDITLFEDFQMSPFVKTEEKILGDADLMKRLAFAYRSGSMAEDYRQQYSDMAEILKELIPTGIPDYKVYAQDFHKRYIGVFTYLDEQLAKQ